MRFIRHLLGKIPQLRTTRSFNMWVTVSRLPHIYDSKALERIRLAELECAKSEYLNRMKALNRAINLGRIPTLAGFSALACNRYPGYYIPIISTGLLCLGVWNVQRSFTISDEIHKLQAQINVLESANPMEYES